MPQPMHHEIGGTLRTLTHLRVQLRVSQRELGAAAGVTQPVVSDHEHGMDLPTERAEIFLAYLRRVAYARRLTTLADLMLNLEPNDLNRPWEEVSERYGVVA